MVYIILGIIIGILVVLLLFVLYRFQKLKDEKEWNEHIYFAERRILLDRLQEQEKIQCVTWDKWQQAKETNQYLTEELELIEKLNECMKG